MSSTTSPIPPRHRCPHCEHSLENQPRGARFCPFCGSSLSTARGRFRQSIHHLGQAVFRPFLDRLRAALERATPLTARADAASRSLVVLGYSAAMYRLGWRYENGSGVARNLDEAYRCYDKSARLGYAVAQDRLVDLPAISTATASSPETVEAPQPASN